VHISTREALQRNSSPGLRGFVGADKSTQDQDIRQAKALTRELWEFRMPKTVTSRWDPAEHLNTEADMAAYRALSPGGNPEFATILKGAACNCRPSAAPTQRARRPLASPWLQPTCASLWLNATLRRYMLQIDVLRRKPHEH
jgi:hypothetical protein